jgi:hypothetical protein
MLCVVPSKGTASKIKVELQESKRREALQKKIAAKIKKDGLLAALEQFGRSSSSSSSVSITDVGERVGDKKGSKKTSLLSSIDNDNDDKDNGILSASGLDLNKSSDSTKVRSLFPQSSSSSSSSGIDRGSGTDRDREHNPLSSEHRQVASPPAGRRVRISLSPHEHGWDSTLDGSDLPDQLYNPHSKHEGNEMIEEEYDQLEDESQMGVVSPLRDSDDPLVMDDDDDAYQSHYSDGVGGHYDSTYSTGDDDSHGDGEESPLGFSYASLSPPPQLNIGDAESNTAAANRTQLSSTANATDRLYISDDED